MISRQHALPLLFALVVIAVTWWLYVPSGGYDFVNFDDNEYVYDNLIVQQGLNRTTIKWAFSTTYNANYHPLTWLSYMTDVSLFGSRPGPMHQVNNVLHALAAGLLWLLLYQILRFRPATTLPTTAALAATCGALLWSLHPLRVESVAWFSSRKDVLSISFCLGGLLLWLANIRTTTATPPATAGWRIFSAPPQHLLSHPLSRFCPPPPLNSPTHNLQFTTYSLLLTQCGLAALLLSFACFALGYLCKPTMMVFPAFIVLLEWYLVGRLRWRPLIPFAVVAIGTLFLTIHAQEGAVSGTIALSDRLLNATISISLYLRQLIWPDGLAVFYPFTLPLVTSAIIGGLVTTVIAIALAIYCWQRYPSVTLALGWFFAALIPVLGFIHVGSASRADRYTYLAMLGFSIALSTAVARLLTRCRSRTTMVGITLVLAVPLLALALTCRANLATWQNTATLFEHAAAVTQRNGMAHTALGNYYAAIPGEEERAARHWQAALAATRNAETLANVAFWTLLRSNPNQRAGAATLANQALLLDPGELMARCALGIFHLQCQEWVAAEDHLNASLASDSLAQNPLVWEWLAMSCANQGKNPQALAAINRALALSPTNPRLHAMRRQLMQRLQPPSGPRR